MHIFNGKEISEDEAIALLNTNTHAIEKKDEKIIISYSEELYKEKLRFERQYKCFNKINELMTEYRGIKNGSAVVKYDLLTDDERQEAQKWYQAWLDVTETNIVPQKPAWLI